MTERRQALTSASRPGFGTDEGGPASETVRLPDGRALHALVWPGTGTPLVLLHGLLDSAEGWDDLCRTSSHPCVAWDLGGFGASDLPARPALSAYADDVVAGLRKLVPGDMVLVGHSLGGGVATAVAERIPGRVRGLVLLAPAGFGRLALAETISLPGIRTVAEQLLPLTLGNRSTVAATYRTVVTNGLEPTDEILARLDLRHDTLVRAAVQATKAVVRAGVSRHAFSRRRVEYDGPVTALWGDHDRVVPLAHQAGLRKAFPQAEVHVWPGMGHHPQRERPAELARLVEASVQASARPAARHVAA